MLPAGGNPTYYVEDMLGSSRVLASNTGVVCYDADFYPYGGERTYINSCPQNYKFEGKERDTETGNDDFGARYYSNRFGRWLSADWSSVPAPIPYANLANPQTLNLYSMVADDPESFADLDGHIASACAEGCGNDLGGSAGTHLASCSPGGFNSDTC
jgi:RHS repeat-associated protein